MKKLYIFDLDGTLLDTLEDLADAANAALSRMGYPVHPVESYRYFVGNGIPKLIERILPEGARTKEEMGRCRGLFDEYYHSHCLDKTRPYPGIPALLEALWAKGIRTAVLTNKADGFAKQILGSIFGEGAFDWVQGQMDGLPKKPAPDGVYQILSALGIKGEDTLFIGDSDVDILTAKNAGVESAGVTWGFRGREELERAGADRLVETAAGLLPGD